jgi:hypothetical protein
MTGWMQPHTTRATEKFPLVSEELKTPPPDNETEEQRDARIFAGLQELPLLNENSTFLSDEQFDALPPGGNGAAAPSEQKIEGVSSRMNGGKRKTRRRRNSRQRR